MYSRFINNSATAPSQPAVNHLTSHSGQFAAKGQLKRMDSVHGRSKELKNFHILSMGHRIQFMQYDEAGVSIVECFCIGIAFHFIFQN